MYSARRVLFSFEKHRKQLIFSVFYRKHIGNTDLSFMENPATKPSSIWPPFVPPFIQSRDGSIPLQNRIILALESLKSIKTSPEGSFQASKHLENTWNPLFRDFVKVWWLLASWLQSVARAPFIQVGFTPISWTKKTVQTEGPGWREGREGRAGKEGERRRRRIAIMKISKFMIFQFSHFFRNEKKVSESTFLYVLWSQETATQPAGWL